MLFSVLRDSTATKKSCNPYCLTNPLTVLQSVFLGVPAPPSGTSVNSNFFGLVSGFAVPGGGAYHV